MLLYTPVEVHGMTLYDLSVHKQEDVDSHVKDILKAGNNFVGERRYRHKDGSVIDVEVHSSVLSYYSQEVVCAFIRDITERKKAEAERERLLKEKSNIARTLQKALL